MPTNNHKRTKRIKPLVDAGELSLDGDKVALTYLDTSQFWKGKDEADRFLDLGKITTVVGPSMAEDQSRLWLSMAACVTVLKGSDTARAAIISEQDALKIRGNLRTAGFDTPDVKANIRLCRWQPRFGWYRDGLGPSRAKERYGTDMNAFEFDLIVVHDPFIADPEEWQWLSGLGKGKPGPAVLITTDDMEDPPEDAWMMSVNHESAFDFSAKLTNTNFSRSLISNADSNGQRNIRLTDPKPLE